MTIAFAQLMDRERDSVATSLGGSDSIAMMLYDSMVRSLYRGASEVEDIDEVLRHAVVERLARYADVNPLIPETMAAAESLIELWHERWASDPEKAAVLDAIRRTSTAALRVIARTELHRVTHAKANQARDRYTQGEMRSALEEQKQDLAKLDQGE